MGDNPEGVLLFMAPFGTLWLRCCSHLHPFDPGLRAVS